MRVLAGLLLCLFCGICSATVVPPNAVLTPGLLCNPEDPNFKGYDYPENVARCNRNIKLDEKLQVAATYGGIPRSDWPNYEFDHLIPLCAGGSNDAKNLWPQPLEEARRKDVLENQVCLDMRAGTMTQAQAVKKIRDWFTSNYVAEMMVLGSAQEALPGHGVCVTQDGIRVRFALASNDRIMDVVINVVSYSGEHEAVRVPGSLEGVMGREMQNPIENGLVHYSFVEAPLGNRFELIFASGIATLPKYFVGYLNVGFEENTYPTLSRLYCNHG